MGSKICIQMIHKEKYRTWCRDFAIHESGRCPETNQTLQFRKFNFSHHFF